jgi:5-formyltetrahydrofolate cyclo-ligase
MAQQRKRNMRQEMRRILVNLDPRWEAVAHQEVCHHLTHLITAELPLQVEAVLAWVPCFPGEVDLSSFIAMMLRTRRVYLPRVTAPGEMSFVRISEEWSSSLERTERGILQPEAESGEVLDFDHLEAIAVVTPGLAFDRTGRRLGRGGGFYDRFFASAPLDQVIPIGVGWSVQVVPEVPVDPHDCSMTWLCHERGVLRV